MVGISSTAPRVTGVVITSDPNEDGRGGNDDTYAAGDVIEVTATLSESVTVDTAGGTPSIELDVGGEARQARYASGTGTDALEFSYTVAAGDDDLDGIEIAADMLDLNDGTINGGDGSGSRAVLNHIAIAADVGHKVDATAPSFVSGKTSLNGETLFVTFSEPITSVDISNIMVGPINEAPISFAIDLDNRAIVELGLDNPLTNGQTVALNLPAGAVTDAFGNTSAVASGLNITNRVWAQPTLAFTSDPGLNGPDVDTYAIGDVIEVTATFEANVSGSLTTLGSIDIGIDVGNATRRADYDPDPLAGDLLRFLYTVAESDEDTDGISVPAGEIKVSGEAIISRLNEVPVLSYAALADDVGHRVDGIRPMFVSGATDTDGTSIVLTFSEPISSADWLAMELQLNGANRQGLLGTIEAEHIDQKSVTVPLLTDFFFIDADDDVGFTFGGASVRDAAGNPNLGSRRERHHQQRASGAGGGQLGVHI